MLVSMARAKLHHARITDANINYVGSITVDTELLDAARMFPYEMVLVVDVDNGARFETYIIPGDAGSRTIQVNGAAAHLVNIGDRIIIIALGMVDGCVVLPERDGRRADMGEWLCRIEIKDEKLRVAPS